MEVALSSPDTSIWISSVETSRELNASLILASRLGKDVEKTPY